MRWIPWLWILLLGACAGVAPRSRRVAGGGDLAILVDDAVAHAGLDGDEVGDLARRSRAAALLPDVTVGLVQTLGQSQSLASTDLSRVALDDRLAWEVRAVWHLDKLAAHPVELGALREADRLRRARRLVEGEVIRAYFEAIRARMRAEHASETGARADQVADLELSAAEAAWRVAVLAGRVPRRLIRTPKRPESREVPKPVP